MNKLLLPFFKKFLLKVFTLSAIAIVLISFFRLSGNAAEKESSISFGAEGEYGSIYGAEYDPENGNTSKWLTVQLGENGIRFINDNNQDIFMVDKYGGVYVTGTFYVNGQEYVSAEPGMFTPENGFLYLLIILSLLLNSYLLYKQRKAS